MLVWRTTALMARIVAANRFSVQRSQIRRLFAEFVFGTAEANGRFGSSSEELVDLATLLAAPA